MSVAFEYGGIDRSPIHWAGQSQAGLRDDNDDEKPAITVSVEHERPDTTADIELLMISQ